MKRTYSFIVILPILPKDVLRCNTSKKEELKVGTLNPFLNGNTLKVSVHIMQRKTTVLFKAYQILIFI